MTIDIIIYRLIVAAGLGLVIGYEREVRGRPAGLRTNMVVTLSSCLLMIISLEFITLFETMDQTSVIRTDPSRIASYAVVGMGFLGAGAIIQGHGVVRGLTTAASLWAGNAVGLAVGAGFILPAIAVTILILVTLLPIRWLAQYLHKGFETTILLDFATCNDKIPEIKSLLKKFGVTIRDISFECKFNRQTSSYEIRIDVGHNQSWSEMLPALRQMEDLTRFRWKEGY